MKRPAYLFISFFILLFVPYSIYSMGIWKSYTIADGLAGGDIHAMIEDKRGYLWIATNGDGVSRYDGEEFSNFTTNQGLISDFVRAILEDRKGDLWFATENGVCKYDGNNFGTNLSVKDGLANNFVTSMTEDREGNLWFGTKNGVSKYNGKTFRNFTIKNDSEDDLIRAILEDSKGNLWFGTEKNGIRKYDGKKFKNFTIKDGLANDSVKAIMEDSDGNLWFGTKEGISRYDGKVFRNFTIKDGLVDDHVTSILEDSNGNLWFGTDGGVSKYNGKNFENFTNAHGLVGNSVRAFSEDREGNIWVGTWGHGISKYNNRIRHYLRDKTIQYSLKDNNGNIWFATQKGGVFRYDGEEFQDFTSKVGLINDAAPTILEDKNGDIWFTGFGEIIRYNGTDFHKTRDAGLSGMLVELIFEDSRGNLWLSIWKNETTIKIGRYDGNRFQYFPVEGNISPSGAEDKKVLEDKSGHIWFASNNGIYLYDGLKLIHYTVGDGLAGNRVSSMLEDKDGNVWFGVRGNDVPEAEGVGGLNKYSGEFSAKLTYQTQLDHISIPEGLRQAFKDNGFSLSQNAGVLVREAGQRWLIKELLFSVKAGFEDELENETISKDLAQEFGNKGIVLSQNIGVSKVENQWLIVDRDKKRAFAIWKNGDKLNVYDNKQTYVIRNNKNRLSIFRFLTYSIKDGLGNDSVTGILMDKDSNLWFRTYHGGFSKYDGKRFENYTMKEGLVSNTIRSMLEDNYGNLWFGSQGAGVGKYDGENFQKLTTEDGLLNNTAFVMLADNRGDIWFRYSVPGLTRYIPSKGILPSVEITQVDADRTYPANSLVRVPPKTRVAFHYKGLTLNQLNNILYVCKLEGYDEGWNPASKERMKVYGNLRPGNYEFQVKAIDRDLNYSEPQRLKLTVRQPRWKRPEYYIPSGFAIIALSLFIFEYFSHRRTATRLKKELQQHELEKQQRIARDLKEAHDVQMKLMSNPLPILPEFEIHGDCKPAREAGGDFFRYISLGQDEKKFALALGDVSGKGLKAAMIASMADGMLNAEVKFWWLSSGKFLPELLSELNKEVYERKTDEITYIAFNFASIDTKEKILQFSNAGLPYPLIKRGEEVITIESPGRALGWFPDTAYEETNITLKEGDIIVFYTDGIIEAQNQEDEQYTPERLENMLRNADIRLSAKQLVDEIFKDVSRFTGKADQYDDMTVLVLKVNGRR